jgi:hypothetical protein
MVVIVLLAAARLLAAPPATLILVSGERVRGELVDLGGVGFTMLVDGRERRIGESEVAVIDFVGGGQGIPVTETSKMQSGRHLVFQRGGDYYYGRLYDIAGDDPLRLTFDTSDGRREMGSNEIGRIYLRRWEGMPTPPPEPPKLPAPPKPPAPQQPTLPGGVRVPANVAWVDTGIQVRSGQMVAFKSSGETILSGDDTDTASPGGAHNGRQGGMRAQLPNIAAGALIGRVGQGAPFGIGDQTQALRMPGTGTLFLAVNDDRPADNRGEYFVEIIVR